MASWKKVLVSGSSVHVLDVTASSVPTGTTEDIVLVASNGSFRKITQASFQGSIGQYAFTASADSGTPSPIASQQTLNIVGGLGITTAVSSAAGTTYLTASVNAGNGIAIVSDNVTVDSGSTHFTNGVRGKVSATAYLAYNSSTGVFTFDSGSYGTFAAGSGIASTNGVLSIGAGNGILVAADSISVDSGSMLPYYSSSIFSKVSGDITISSAGVATIGTGVVVDADIATGTITNSKLVNSSVYITAGNGLTGDGSVALGATASLAVGAGSGIAANANDIALKNAGSLTNNYHLKWDSGNTQLANSIVSESGTDLTVAGTVSTTRLNSTGAITGSAVSSSGAIIGNSITSATTVIATGNITTTTGNIGTTSGNITTVSGYMRSGNPAGAPGAIGSVEAESFFTNGAVTAGSVSVSGNATITGNLTVNGTTTTINTTNVSVTDAFILLASGSSGTVDGGIIVQNAANAGEALYWENNPGTTGRWAVSSSVAPNATTAAATNFLVTVQSAAGVPSAAPYYGGSGVGYGNMYVNSTTGDIFIYS